MILNATQTPTPVYSILLYDFQTHLSYVSKQKDNENNNFMFYGFQVHLQWIYLCNSKERLHPIFYKNMYL